jgi:hypothetical protein
MDKIVKAMNDIEEGYSFKLYCVRAGGGKEMPSS